MGLAQELASSLYGLGLTAYRGNLYNSNLGGYYSTPEGYQSLAANAALAAYPTSVSESVTNITQNQLNLQNQQPRTNAVQSPIIPPQSLGNGGGQSNGGVNDSAQPVKSSPVSVAIAWLKKYKFYVIGALVILAGIWYFNKGK